MQSQQQPTCTIEEVIETRGFVRKNGDGRNADRRLANHRLQLLGHLTAARGLSVNAIVARLVTAAITGATFSPCFMATTRTLGLIQGFDGRTRRFGGRRERLSARSEVLMQRAAELAEFLDARVDILDSPGE
jgi:hypothetical protein